MTYKLRFHAMALAEWQNLDGSIKVPFKKKLSERLENPHVQADALSAMNSCYKIKLKRVGFRLVYRMDDDVVTVIVIAVGKRDKSAVYSAAKTRL